MLYRTHVPPPPLSQFVNVLWLYEGYNPTHEKERVLPTGTVEVVINLTENVIASYDRETHERNGTFPGALVIGTRSEYFVIDTGRHETIMGVNFKPGGAFPFFGMPVGELHGLDVPLDTFWGADAVDLREALLEAATTEARFGILERTLLRLLARRGWHPAVAFALGELHAAPSTRTIAELVARTGISQRRFIQLFREQVGMTPKLYTRVRRFREVVARIGRPDRIDWIDVALGGGYYDQAHFIRDFRAFSGINPTTYLAELGPHPYHVPIRD